MHIPKLLQMRKSSLSQIAVIVTYVLVSFPVYASEGVLEEIVVTAQKRAESVQEVPISVTALDADALTNRQIEDIVDLQNYVPSLHSGQFYGTNQITLRGVSTSQTPGSEDPSVAVHVNGVYQPRARTLDVVLVDLAQVEVLSGPQGTLYGRNATGGVVNYTTKGASEEFEGHVTLKAANYDRQAVSASISGPLSDNAGFRLSALYDDQSEGFTDNLANGETLEARKVEGFHGLLSLAPTERLTLDLDVMYVDSEDTQFWGLASLPDLQFFRDVLAPQTTAPHKVYADFEDERLNSEFQQYSMTANWEISEGIELKSITAFQSYEGEQAQDVDASAAPMIGILQKFESDTFSQELNLTTHTLGNRLTSVYGLFYLDDDLQTVSDSLVDVILPAPLFVDITFDGNTKSYAAFMDHIYDVSDDLRIFAGIRYTRDEKEAARSEVRSGLLSISCFDDDSLDWDETTWRVGTQYHINDSVMVYAQWQKSYKAGGLLANTCNNNYDPEYIEGPEIGLKSDLLNNRLRLNLAAWLYDYEGLQVQQSIDIGRFETVNAAEARLKGIEVSVRYLLTDSLELDLSAMAQSAKYTEFFNCNAAAFPGACSATDPRQFDEQLQDLSGNWLNRAAPRSANLGLSYTMNLDSGAAITMRAESFWTGEIHFDEYNNSEIIQPSYDVQNLFVTYTSPSRRYTVRGFARNLGDEEYLVVGWFSGASRQFAAIWAYPRTYGVEVQFEF